MNYAQTLDFLFTRLPMYSRIGAAAYKADLTNTIALCAMLGNPQEKFKSVHIAGTNGKGSTSHLLAAVLQTAGYKTGLYTSPHLKDFRERIKINGHFIEEDFVVNFVERIMPLIDKLEPSFFEITVAMSFDYFVQQQVDIAVIEVGLGGRLDSTNIITPELAVITNIGWDHTNLLGNSLAAIAGEKAGIIKPLVPVVIGEWLPETKPVFVEKAKQEKAALTLVADEWYCAGWQQLPSALDVETVEKSKDLHKVYSLDLQGLYQTKNVLTVLEAIRQLQNRQWIIDELHIQNGLKHAKKFTGLHGRWDTVHREPTVVLDVAHNEDGIRQVMEQIETTDHDNLHIIIGLVKDKETETVLSLLPKSATCYFTKAQIPRALPEHQLAAMGIAAGLTGQSYTDVNTALKTALARARKHDLLIVCGSVFVVGEVTAI